jgi:hypothetical protein
MPTQHGVTDSEIYRQPGSTFSDADGTFTGSAVYAMTLNAWNNNAVRSRFKIGNTFYQLDPDCPIVVRFMVIENVQPSYEEGNTVFVTVNFVGSQVAQYSGETLGTDAITTYRLEGRLSDMSLSEHPKWKELDMETKFFLGKAISGNAEINDDNTIAWYYSNLEHWITSEPLTGDALEFLLLILNGETTYIVPSITWTETTQGETGMTAQQINKLGRISTPRGSPPTLTGSRNWMLTGASQEQRGTIYQTQIEWTVSERKGYNSFLYDT